LEISGTTKMTFSCYYCYFQTADKQEYQEHGVTEHRGKPRYPGQADIEYYGLKPQGQWWERPVDNREAIFRYTERKPEVKKKEEDTSTTIISELEANEQL
jgi:hypothetical protein